MRRVFQIPWTKWPTGLWLLLTAVSMGALSPAFVQSLRPARDQWSDFFQDWASARNRLVGQPVYASHKFAVQEHLGFDPQTDVNHLTKVANVITRNPHPPTSVLLAVPFALLSYPNAVLVWNLISLGALAASLWIVRRQLSLRVSPAALCPLAMLLLFCGPLWMQVILGQFNLVLLLLLTATWALDRERRPIRAGILLGVATAIKLFPGFLILYFALQRQWKAVRSAAAAFTIVTVITSAVLGAGTFRTYFSEVLPGMRMFRSAWNNASLAGFWNKLFNPVTGEAPFFCVQPLFCSPYLAGIATVASGAGVAGVLAVLIRSARSREQCDDAFGLTLLAMLLISPVTWEHYFLLLLVPVVLFMRKLSSLSRGPQIVFLLSTAALWINPRFVYKAFIPGGITSGTPTPFHTVTILSFQFYGLVGLFGLGIVLALRRREGARGRHVVHRHTL